MVWLQGQQFKPTEAYEAEVNELSEKIKSLSRDIEALQIQKEELISGNAQILKDKIAQSDAVISEQHQIKQRLLDGANELNEKIKAHQENVKSIDESKSKHEKNVNDFKAFSDEKIASLSSYEESLKKEDQRLKLLKDDIEAEKADLYNKRESIIKQLEASDASKLEMTSLASGLDRREYELKQREITVEAKYAKYCADNAELIEAKDSFASSKEALERKAAQIAAGQDDINRKIDVHNSLIIQNSKMQADIEQKRQLLEKETQNNLCSIADLLTLKEQLIKQGAINEKPAEIPSTNT